MPAPIRVVLNGLPEKAMGTRYFLFEDDGTMLHLPQRVLEGLIHDADRLPQYAGRKIRSLALTLELHNKKPIRVTNQSASIWHFDSEGSLQQSLVNNAFALMNLSERERREPAQTGPVVDISTKLDRKRFEQENRWEPTQHEITQAVNAIWPENAGGSAERPKTITGEEKRKLPVSHATKRALRQCLEPTYQLHRLIGELTERDLKPFIAEARDDAEQPEPVSGALWSGILAAAEKQPEIRAAWRIGKGKWFAEIEKTVPAEGRSYSKCVTVEWRECDGKAAAVTAAREMLAKHAALFDADVEIQARICPEIEWLGPSD